MGTNKWKNFTQENNVITTQQNYKIGNVSITNIKVRSCNHCYSGKAIGFTYSEYVFLALGIQHAMRMRMRDIVICGLPVSAIFFHFIS